MNIRMDASHLSVERDKSVGTEERMVSRIQGSKIANEKISTRTGNHKNISE